MEWQYGFSATYYAYYIDPVTWRDIERFEITSGSITREDSALMESADLTCTQYDPEKESWVRVYLVAKQDDDSERVPLFTGLATSPDVDIDGTLVSYPMQLYSVLKPAEDILLQRGWYAPAEVPGAELVRQLLSVSPCPVVAVEGSASLSQSIIAEDGESNLTMAGKILEAINWRLRISGDGTVTICPKADDVSQTFSASDNDSVEPKLKVEHDWYESPNVFRAVNGTQSGVARDDDPKSPLSTVSRGREVWMEETDCDFIDGETVAEYAMRRLKEEQNSYMKITYGRRFDPNITVGDLVMLNYPLQGINGVFRVTSQTIDLGYGARTSEEAVYGG